jgi:BCCT family betaine/carnitine transporter
LIWLKEHAVFGPLQAASVSTGLPFAVVLLLGSYALIKGLMSESRR